MDPTKAHRNPIVPEAPTQQSGDDRRNRRTAPIQVEKDLAKMAATIASHDGISQAALISPQIRQFLKTQYERVQREISAQLRRMNAEDRSG